MKKNYLRIFSLCVLAALLFVIAVPVFAADQKAEMPLQTFWAGEQSWRLGVYNAPKNARFVSVKSSNPKVLKVVKDGTSLDDIFWSPLKAGKSKVTVTYKVGKKKTAISATYTVKKFPSPFSELKINGKSIKPTTSCKNVYTINNYKKTKATITFPAKKGWTNLEKGFEVFGGKRFEIKSGKSFKIPKGKSGYAVISFQNEKTKDIIIYFINFFR